MNGIRFTATSKEADFRLPRNDKGETSLRNPLPLKEQKKYNGVIFQMINTNATFAIVDETLF